MAVKINSRTRQAAESKQGQAVDWQEVSRVAYELYEKRGRLDGYDQQDWFEAMEIVSRRKRPARSYAA